PDAVGLELLAGFATGVAAAALLAGALSGFDALVPALIVTAGGLLGVQAAGLWFLRRWARRHPSHGRSIGLPFERSMQARTERLAPLRARRASRHKDSDLRVVAGLVIGRTQAGGGDEAATPTPPPAGKPKRHALRFLYLPWIGIAMVIWP